MNTQSTPTAACFTCGNICQFVAVHSNTEETLWRCTECGVQISMSGLMAVHKTSEALAKERGKNLRIVRGEFGQICSYCGWESSSEGASWEELQAHINNCTAHPLFALHAELSDALARVGEMTETLKWVDESFNGRHRHPAEHMLQIAHKAQEALALTTLGAASRLRDDIYEECRGIIAEVVNTAWIDFGSNGFWAASQQDAVTGLGRRIDDAIRALKSKEADQ